MKFTKDGGLRVSVKDQGDEKLGDKTQKYATSPTTCILAFANSRQCSRQRLEQRRTPKLQVSTGME